MKFIAYLKNGEEKILANRVHWEQMYPKKYGNPPKPEEIQRIVIKLDYEEEFRRGRGAYLNSRLVKRSDDGLTLTFEGEKEVAHAYGLR